MTAKNMKAGIVIAVLAGALTWTAGCASDSANVKVRPEVLPTPSDVPLKPPGNESRPKANRYYFYIEAQLQKNRGNLKAAVNYLKAAINADPEAFSLKKELAILYLRQQNYEKSLEIVNQMLAEQPKAVEILLIKASVLQTIDSDADVTPLYEKALSIEPGRKEVYKVLGKLYLEKGAPEQAAEVFAQMVKRFPEAYVAHFYLGRIYSELGRYEKAETAFERTIDLAPELNQPRWELINLYKTRGTEKDVVALYEQILQHNPKNVAAAIELSLAYAEKGREAKAKEMLAELGQRSIEDTSVIRSLLQRLVLENRFADALTVLDGMRRGAPANSGLHYATGVVYFNQDLYPKAVAAFVEVSPESLFYVNAVIHRGLIAYKQGDLDQAIEILNGAMDAVDEAGQHELIPYLSSFYQEEGDLQKAERMLQRGLEIAPESSDLHFELGVLYDEQGKKAAAMEQMHRVLEIESDHADALNYIGYSYADQGIHLDKAEAMLRKALEQKPENGYIIDSMGWLYYRKGLFEKALTLIEKAARLIPDDPVVLEHLGDVYVRLKKPGKALDAYLRAIDMKGENTEALERKIKDLQKDGS